MRAIIVENEPEGMENMVLKLEKNCPQIEVVAKCFTGESAIRAIRDKNPQLVFLDIQLGTMTGFDVLSKVQQIPFEVIFTTSYEEYAIQAIRANAIDYILKPVRPAELIKAIELASERILTSTEISRILVPDGNSYKVIYTKNILYCIADNVNTFIHQIQKEVKPYLVVKTLKSINSMLPKDKFYRISRSVVVNIDYIDTVHRADGGGVVMKDKTEFSVSKGKMERLLYKLGRNF